MYQIGEEYELHTKIPKKNKFKMQFCKIIQECERFVVVDLGNYRDTVTKIDIKNGQVKLLKKGEIEMPKEPKITREQLLQECFNNGIDKESLEEIAKKYKMSHITIKAYFHKWGIKEELSKQKDKFSADKDADTTVETNKEIDTEMSPEDRYTLTEKGDAAAKALGKSKSALKPYVFAGRHFVYELLAEEQVAITIEKDTSYTLEDIDSIIIELQELKQYIS